MTTRAEFLDILDIRGWGRDRALFLPGPDRDRRPDGMLVVRSPADPGDGWRSYLMDEGRGPQDEAVTDSESAAYDHLLDDVIPSAHGRPVELVTFLRELAVRGLDRGRVCLPGETNPHADYTIVADTPEGPWHVQPPIDGNHASWNIESTYAEVLTRLTEQQYRQRRPDDDTGAAADQVLAALRELFSLLDALLSSTGRPIDKAVAAHYVEIVIDDEFPPAELLGALAGVWFRDLQLRDGGLANAYISDAAGGVAREPTRRLHEIVDAVSTLTRPWFEEAWASRVIGDVPGSPGEPLEGT